ncbi:MULTISPECIES: nucleotidyltransferase family protein [Sinorhizobium/Ensifer group]|uniref:nucleotidyltransferase family protein n=1 Tax=Sinorhizobium/Ensifer group TaxID=227292 RepID=UPI0007101FFD|nr:MULTISPECIES: nucleotidyltransferase family protein [Sinorhizobium/Ensifer group]KRD60713.1 mannose-1-phosphate guanylyltransferase [Ensifer sp. Root278]KSV73195.1 mannose-1-phosphate guanylyltransferase [Sinorhizobium sp. Sb3]KSV93446.1 mannose-1-phosphate guanylyltransferase [Sinorhizobium sp. GL28]MBD9509507.1 nucleotidyltransferase family protein [Ensifer sp. ENS10]SDA76083.1 Nucleotidyl transferase [Sinorhizobium sp. NFACC03]
MSISNAMVLAAGLGTRLRPITNTMPKPLVEIAGKPMIDYVLDLLAEAGITKAAVNVHHFADQMEGHLSQRRSPEILISDERDALMNSGGGLAKGLKLLPEGPVLVMNADLFWVGEPVGVPSNLTRLAAAFDADRMDMLLLCVRDEDTTGHNGKKDFSLGADGKLTRYTEGLPNPVVYAGAIALHSRLFADAPDDAFNLNIYFDRAAQKGRLHGLLLDGHWMTVGTPDAIGEAEAAIRRHQPGG